MWAHPRSLSCHGRLPDMNQCRSFRCSTALVERLVALMALGMTFAAVCVERDSQAVQIVQRSFRHVRHWPDVTTFDIALLEPALQSRRFSSVFGDRAGSPPCQQASLLNAGHKGSDAAASRLFEYVPTVSRNVRRLIKSLRHVDPCAVHP